MTENMPPTYALVTGASRGLGRFFARALAERKQNLVLVARSKDKLEALAQELSATHNILAVPLEFDLATQLAGKNLAEALRERELRVELLVNNAGYGLRGAFCSLPLDEQLRMVHLQNDAVVELTYSLLPFMIEEHRGGIINVSSMAGLQPIPYAALYSATKSFLTTFSMALREEIRASGVKVVTVCPGRLRADPEEAAESEEKRQKVPGGEQSHEEVVSLTLKKFDSGGGLVIPGRINRMMAFGQRLMPPNAVPKIIARMSKP